MCPFIVATTVGPLAYDSRFLAIHTAGLASDLVSTSTVRTAGDTDSLMVSYGGLTYPAEPVATGAAFEIVSSAPTEGFVPNPRDTSRMTFRRFVHATEATVMAGAAPIASDAPLCVPLSATMSWAQAHRTSQTAAMPGSHEDATLRAMRATVRVHRGTRMIKILSGRQLAGTLRGWLPQGFCHREYDIAHLRTPEDLAVLATDRDDRHGADQAVFALRWRAIDPADYAVPYVSDFAGLVAMSPHQRVGSPVLGTGFAPTNRHIIPEFITADLADLPLPVHAELLAFTADGTEVLLYHYLGEQRAWARLAGKQWYGLLDGIAGMTPDQEYFPITPSPTSLLGWHNHEAYEAIADPRENEFIVLAKVRALRHVVTDPVRRTPTATWREVPCSIVRTGDEWTRLRLLRPSPEALEQTGAVCVERGIYEVWAPTAELTDPGDIIVHYSPAA